MVKKNWFNGVAMPAIAVRELDGSDQDGPPVRISRLRSQPFVKAILLPSEGESSHEMKKHVLIIGAGGVAQVVAHKCAQNNDVLGDIHIASRTLAKCEAIIASVRDKDGA